MTDSADSKPLASICPLCGNDNQCAIAAGRPADSCWCWDATLDPEARAKAADYANERCVCPACGLPTEEQPNAG